jgi:hypothetical protein
MNSFQHNNMDILSWPPQSSDCDSIENVWFRLKYELDKERITSKTLMRQKIQQLWAILKQDICNA